MFVGHLRPEKGGAFPAFTGGHEKHIYNIPFIWICVWSFKNIRCSMDMYMVMDVVIYIYIYSGCSYIIVYVMEN